MDDVSSLKAQIARNSLSWHTADETGKKQLEAANKALYKQLDSITGSTSTFDASSGKWSTTGAARAPATTANAPATTTPAKATSTPAAQSQRGNDPYQSGKDDYGDTDYSVLLQRAMAAGASASEVKNLLDQRVNKAVSKGYEQYAYDDIYKQAKQYIDSQTAKTQSVQPQPQTGNNPYQSGKDDYGDTDYSVLLMRAMAAGAPQQEVQDLLNRRVEKALQKGYTQYAYDDIYTQAKDYIRDLTAQQEQAKKDRLAAAQIGAEQTAKAHIQAPEVQKAADYSDYIRQLNELSLQNQLNELQAAYEQNVNAYNAARDKITPQYDQARNQAAGQAALAQQSWNQTAAALGLNSGAAGQAALAQNVALQSDLNQLGRAESQDLAELDLQMTQTETQYNNAIAQAKAQGNLALAQALYQEKVRVEQANREAYALAWQQQLQAAQFNRDVDVSDRNYNYMVQQDQAAANQWQQSFDYQKQQDALAQQNWQQQLAYQQQQDALAQQNWLQQFNYGVQQDQAAANQWQQSFDYQKQQDALAQQNWQQQLAYQQQQDALAQQNWLQQFNYGVQQDQTAANQWQQSFDYQKQQDALAQQNYLNEFLYQQAQDAQAQQNYRNEFAYQQAQDAQAQQNYRNEFAYQQAQDAQAQQNYRNEFAYQQAQDAQAQQNYLQEYGDKRTDAQRDQDWQLASTLAENTGDFSLFSSFGLSQAQIDRLGKIWQEDRDIAVRSAQAAASLTQAQAQAEQAALNPTASSTAGQGEGLPDSRFQQAMRSVVAALEQEDVNSAQKRIASFIGQINAEQYQRLRETLARYGYDWE